MRKAIPAVVTVVVCLAIGGERSTELPLERTDVEVDVSGSVVSATVNQRFTNSSKEPIEVVYLFPLSQRAAVDAMEMKVGSARTVKASIAKRADARAAYDRAIQQGHRARSSSKSVRTCSRSRSATSIPARPST